MKSVKEFPFEKARRVSAAETAKARKAIAKHSGKPRPIRPGRPRKSEFEKYVPISLRLHPDALEWLRREARRSDLPYQTIINDIILSKIESR